MKTTPTKTGGLLAQDFPPEGEREREQEQEKGEGETEKEREGV
jgi:hypothetical protein